MSATIDKVVDRVVLDPSGCWLFEGGTSGGYGTVQGDGQRTQYAHRITYQHFVGMIPEGRELDHLCRTPRCVNPWHLEPVTHRENMLRGQNACADHARKTHCKSGHPLSGDNLRIRKTPYGTGRVCITCANERNRLYQCGKVHT
jgi:hypothetical protein